MKEVIVFGAGASSDCGLPLGRDLVWKTPAQLMKKIYEHETGDVDLEFLQFVKHFRNYEEISPQVQREFYRYIQSKKSNELYYPPDLSKLCYVDEILSLAARKNDDTGLKIVQKLIAKHLLFSSHKFSRQRNVYEDYVKAIFSLRDDLSIISFNFDTLLHEDWMAYVNGEGNNVAFDYLITFDGIYPQGGREKTYKKGDKVIPLIKLHGSLDWSLCSGCGYLSLNHFDIDECFYDEYVCLKCKKKATVTPFLIYPHQNIDEKLKSIWEIAKVKLLEADMLTIVGYSFPPYDYNVNELFNCNLNENVQIKVIEIKNSKIDNPDRYKDEVKNKYMRFFPHLKNELDIQLIGFKEYVEKLVSTKIKKAESFV